MITVLLNSLRRKAFSDSYFPPEKLRALPTANKKEGKTRSVGVNPNQGAWSSGTYGSAPEPGAFTMIMKQIVNPLKISSDRKRSCLVSSLIQKWFIVCLTRMSRSGQVEYRCPP